MIKIATWNINSINIRKNQLLKWLHDYKPDIVLLQEIKCESEKFPRDEIEELGFNLSIHGQKGFNGVAILSKFRIDEFVTALPETPLPDQARYIEAIISVKKIALRVASVYVPNGEDLDSLKYQAKLNFLDSLKSHVKSLLEFNECLVIGGDFNIAPEDMDSYDPLSTQDTVLFSPEVRKKFRSLLNLGLSNAFRLANPNEHQFSWWDYRRGAWEKNQGMLIDHLLLSPEAADRLKTAEILSNWRNEERPSDHAPVVCTLDIEV